MANVAYVKVDEHSPEVVALATQLNQTPKTVAALINQDRYRRAYNKLRQEEMKVLRRLIKDNPELIKEVKS